MQAPRLLSLYTGAGGFDIGFAEAGFTPVFAIDVDPDATETYLRSRKRLSHGLPTLDVSEHECHTGDVADHLPLIADVRCEVVVGGPPCQGFSVAGKMDPGDHRSRHVWLFLKAVELTKPRAFVMENVPSLGSNHRWTTLMPALRSRAEAMGYRTTKIVLNSADFGVPQSRRRLFLVGTGLDASDFEIPLGEVFDAPPTARATFESLPPWGEPGNDTLCNARVVPMRRPQLRRSPYAGKLFDGAGRPVNLDSPAPTIAATQGGNRTHFVDQNHLMGLDDCWVKRYHRHLRMGGAPYRESPERLRRLTVEESAALQGFPQEMEWCGPKSAAWRLIGNAVPPALGRAIGESLLRALSHK